MLKSRVRGNHLRFDEYQTKRTKYLGAGFIEKL